MKLLYISILISFFLTLSCEGQKSEKITSLAHLPSLLKESSGIENLTGSSNFWMINDSGNSNELFEINELGKILRIVKVTNTRNKDWEDLASNGLYQIFIGDFGNNNNKRKNLAIHSVNIKEIVNDEVKAITTTFYFEDQKKFPPKKIDRNFDVEAFVYKDGYFYLFTKNRSSKFDGVTKLYKILAIEGQQKAILMDKFITCQDNTTCLITAAALSKDKKELVLLTHNRLFRFTNFNGDDFFKGLLTEVHLNHKTQKEALCFKGNQLYITDESVRGLSNKLYKVLN